MRTLKDLSNLRFGAWLVIKEFERSALGRRMWLCRCDCGAEYVVDQGNLTTGKSTRCVSCSAKASSLKHGFGKETSGLYNIWKGMKSRCQNSNRGSYHRYGGRGIKVYEEWETFGAFVRDMGVSYQEGLSLDRINNDGDYEPDNCRWVTPAQQQSNTSKNVRIDFKGCSYTEAELSRLTGVPRTTLQARRRRGLKGEDIVYGTGRVQETS